jgi:hypothetical protein
MTFEQIELITIEQYLGLLIGRILDLSQVPEGEPVYMLDQDEELDFYERIIVHQSLVKPPLENLEAELAQYKEELRVAEQARLDEIARVKDIKDRWSVITDIRGVIDAKTWPNPAKLLEKIIKEDDQAELSNLENLWSIYLVDKAAKDQEESRDQAIEHLFETIQGCIKMVALDNIARGLTSQQKDDQEAMYSNLFKALKDYRPAKFKSLLVEVVVDGTLVNQELKDNLLAYLASRGL